MFFTNNIIVLFILAFFLIFFSLTYFKVSHKTKNNFISFSSLLFYATWYPPAIILLFYHTFLGVYGSKKISSLKENKYSLFLIIFFTLLPLLFFKYYDFFIDILGYTNHNLELVLPLGLSFYTFSLIGYYIDIYHKKIEAQQSFMDILLFISFWPHLAAGPILRAKNIFSTTHKEEKVTQSIIILALTLIAIGLVKKLLIADNIGAYVNWNISYGVEEMNILEAWSTILGFSAQIYADFSGYSDMAIGFALLMGFKLPANFNYPYRATSMTDFWHRWHISLSTWFRDYLYFPLGGSKYGSSRTYFNILIVFILSGMWHGAGIGFVIWGAIHGMILVIEKIFSKKYFSIHFRIRWIITIVLVVIAWSFFRLHYLDAIILVQKMFGFHNSLFINLESPYYIGIIIFFLLYPIIEHTIRFYKVSSEGYPIINRNIFALITLSLLLFTALIFSGSPLPFIYFEF